jgi:hypothetical protein
MTQKRISTFSRNPQLLRPLSKHILLIYTLIGRRNIGGHNLPVRGLAKLWPLERADGREDPSLVLLAFDHHCAVSFPYRVENPFNTMTAREKWNSHLDA